MPERTKPRLPDEPTLGGLAVALMVLAGLFVFLSFLAPHLFTLEGGPDFSTTGPIGDTIGGLMNPFIGIAGVILTFVAFYIQYQANRLQYRTFRTEFERQNIQADKAQVENQFYQMLDLHKANVNEITIILIHFTRPLRGLTRNENKVSGRPAFTYLKKEFELCLAIARKYFPEATVQAQVNEAYGAFFLGLNPEIRKKHAYYQKLFNIQSSHKVNGYSQLTGILRAETQEDMAFELNYSIFEGHSSQLAHYYRHLFQTVKFIVHQPEDILTYEDKRKYLRMLRAQLSNEEQAMLFYNWMSRFGHQWENRENKFFTDYRMVHNIHPGLFPEDIRISDLLRHDDLRKEKNREKDSLFEYEDLPD